jgi:hypothetical protein
VLRSLTPLLALLLLPCLAKSPFGFTARCIMRL